jgi:hypothetical protein
MVGSVWMSLPRDVQARADIKLLSLDDFVAIVENGEAETLRGVYVPEIFASEVVQQPVGNSAYVSPLENTLTQFQLASRFGSIGLLAHDYLAGYTFFLLAKGQKFYLIYGDGETKAFVVTQTLRYRALQPESSTSKFVDLADGHTLTASKLFRKVYNRPDHVILQTCIYSDGIYSWGRLFVVAKPYKEEVMPKPTIQPTIQPTIHIMAP